MSLIISDYDIYSEDMNPSSNSSKAIFSVYNPTNSTTSTNSIITKSSSSNNIRDNIKVKETYWKEKNESNNYFLEINSKNSFKINHYNKYLTDLDNILNINKQNEYNLETKIKNTYLNILFPKCNQDPFLISQYIIKNIYSNQNQKKQLNKEIESQIEYFVQSNKKMKNNVLSLNYDNILSIGYILHNSYNNFKYYNIDNMQKFENAVNELLLGKINIFSDYSDFCEERKKIQKNYSIGKFISNRKKINKYCLPTELIFLIKYLNNINILEINFEDLKFEQNNLFFYILTILNIQIIFPKINNIKINMINIPFQNKIYSRLFRLEKEALKKTNKYIKSFDYSNNKNIFRKKWNFINVFYVAEKKVEYLKKDPSSNTDYNINLMNENIHINELINEYTDFLNSILITFFSLFDFINMNQLELILNDSYTLEFQYFFKKYSLKEISPFFHILNFIKNKENIKSLNVELNALDYITSKKIFYLIYKNKSLSELQISFFSSDVTYFQQTIYKLYSQYINIKKENKIYFVEEPETDILNFISKYFEKNLNILFDIIVKKKNLTKLGLYFEVPSILINNQNYMILILKFIINIIFFIDDENSKLNTLTLLSPYTVLDKTLFPCIDDYLEDLEISEKNHNLLYLNLQLKIYKIVNIKKLISTNLIILNIGDFDLESFEIIIDYLISYNFSFKSNLKYLTLGLLKSIIDYNKNIHNLLNKLYSIKKQQLYELNVYTNLIINNEEKYLDLINILKNRWIPLSTIVLNDISTKTLEKFKDYINNINYIVPVFIDEIKSDERKKNITMICYWYLKYIFFRKLRENNYKDNMNNICDKNIYEIFKFLCYERKMSISHQLNNDSNFGN